MCLYLLLLFFFFNDTATTEIYTLSLHDALPIFCFSHTALLKALECVASRPFTSDMLKCQQICSTNGRRGLSGCRSEEHTSELQSRQYLVCRLLLEKKKKKQYTRLESRLGG